MNQPYPGQAVLTEYKRALLTAKSAKTKLKANRYIAKIALQTEATQAKKIQTNFESKDVMRLLDARRFFDHQYIHKAINPAVTKDNMVACNNKKLGGSIVMLCLKEPIAPNLPPLFPSHPLPWAVLYRQPKQPTPQPPPPPPLHWPPQWQLLLPLLLRATTTGQE